MSAVTHTPWVNFDINRARWTDRDGGQLEFQTENQPFVEFGAPMVALGLGTGVGAKLGGAKGSAIGAGVGLLAGVGAGILLSRGHGETKTEAMTRSEWDRARPQFEGRKPSSMLGFGTGLAAFSAVGIGSLLATTVERPAVALPVSIGAALLAGGAAYVAGRALDD